MKRLLVTLIALTLTAGTVQAASFGAQQGTLPVALATLHTSPNSAHVASYSHTSLSAVVGAYWQALRDLGYQGSLTEASANSTTYLFEGSGGTLEATFSLTGDEVSTTVNQL